MQGRHGHGAHAGTRHGTDGERHAAREHRLVGIRERGSRHERHRRRHEADASSEPCRNGGMRICPNSHFLPLHRVFRRSGQRFVGQSPLERVRTKPMDESGAEAIAPLQRMWFVSSAFSVANVPCIMEESADDCKAHA